MRISRKVLESQSDDIKKLTGLNLSLDCNIAYGGYLVYLIPCTQGGPRSWHTSIRKSTNAMSEYLNGILIGIELTSVRR